MLRTSRPVRRVATFAASAALMLGSVGLTALPAAAASSSSAGLVSLAHHRVLDAAVKARTAVGFALKGLPKAGVSAAVLTVSVTAPASSGTLVVYPYGAKRPASAALSFSAGHAASVTVVVKPGTKSRLLVYSSVTVRAAATLTGYYAVAGASVAAHATAAFLPLSAKRLGVVSLRSKGSGSLVASGKGGVPAVDVAGVTALVTATATRSGSLTVYPDGNAKAHTSVALVAGRSTSALVTVKPGSHGRIAVTNASAGAVKVAVDVVGYLLTLRAPTAPRSVAATAMNAAARVSWRAPADDGGTPVTAYTVVAEPGGVSTVVGAAATSAVVAGLTNGTPYTLSVTATNARGHAVASATVTPFTVPSAPAAPTATSTAAGTATVTWTAPATTGGAAVTGYQVVATPGGSTVTSTATSTSTTAIVSGLLGGTFYTFTVSALNPAGSSAPSLVSSLVLVQGISRASSAPTGDPGNGDSAAVAVSAHGRLVAFQSSATNLVSVPVTGNQVYVRDRTTGVVSLVSVTPTGAAGNGSSTGPTISGDGRFVAFSSAASNLVPGDTNNTNDVFVRDLTTGKTTLVSSAGGVPANQLSYQAEISEDGTAVAFTSYASNLTSVDTGGQSNVYVVPLATGVPALVSVASNGGAATNGSNDPAISGDGFSVAFESTDTGLQTAVTTTASNTQVYVRNLHTGVTSLVSHTGATVGNGNSLNPSVSQDGTYVAFGTLADNLVAAPNSSSIILVADTATHVLTAVGPGPAQHPSISGDGTLVAYDTSSPPFRSATFPPGHHLEIVRAQWQQGTTLLVSSGAGGVEGNGDSTFPSITNDGQHVGFQSLASNLTSAATNPSIQALEADLG